MHSHTVTSSAFHGFRGSGPGSNSSGPGWAPLCAGRCWVRVRPGSPGGRSSAAPAPRPAAAWSRAPPATLPAAAAPTPRLSFGLGPRGEFAHGRSGPLPPLSSGAWAPSAPGERATRAAGRLGARAPKGSISQFIPALTSALASRNKDTYIVAVFLSTDPE